MSSSYVRLCLRCRSFLSSKTVTKAAQYSTQVHRRTTVTNKIQDGSLFLKENHRATDVRGRWTQQSFYCSDLAAKHLGADAKEAEFTEELSGTGVVPHKNTLLPVRDAVWVNENQTPIDLDAAPQVSALETISEQDAISITVPAALPPTSTSLRDYVDKSETLTKLVQLGVDLWKLEQRANVGSMLLKLDFDADVAPRLLFLKQIGVEDSRLGHIITTNPFFLTECLENLETRVEYLKSKKFDAATIASMVSRAPYLLNFSAKRLDNRLGFFQENLKISAFHTRNIVARLPRLLCSSLEPVKENLKVYEIELGFKANEIQHMVITVPKVLTSGKKKLIQIFDFVHNTMKVPHHLITKFPQILNAKFLRIRERHLFLEYLGKDQYDPNLPNYIALDRFATLPDNVFCTELASTTLEDFNLFQKTL